MHHLRRGHAAGCRADAKDPIDAAELNRTLHATHVPPVGSPFPVPHPLADANCVLHVSSCFFDHPSTLAFAPANLPRRC